MSTDRLGRESAAALDASAYQSVIWEGRFQPIHMGHVRYVERLLGFARDVWIFVVANEASNDVLHPGEKSLVPEFTREVDRHHGREKNPLPFWLRYQLVVETLRAEFADAPITVWGGRRLDLAWPLYASSLPPHRVFATPKRDAFEDVKAAAWRQLGEKVVRVDVADLPSVSATQLRALLTQGLSTEGLLHPVTAQLLQRHGYLLPESS